MLVTVKGTVMEMGIAKGKGDKEDVPYIRLYQKGEKSIMEIKKVPIDLFGEGEIVSVECKAFPWANDSGQASISFSYVDLV